MKTDRNCAMGMMPNYGGMQMMPQPMINYPYDMINIPNEAIYSGDDLTKLSSQINTLEQRVARLETLVNTNNYSNNQMM